MKIRRFQKWQLFWLWYIQFKYYGQNCHPKFPYKIGVKKRAQFRFQLKQKLSLFIFIKEEFMQSGFFIFSKFSACFFFLTLKVIVSSTQFFLILENFDMKTYVQYSKSEMKIICTILTWVFNFFILLHVFPYIKLKIWIFLNFHQNHT